ncbi:hypothetical protein PILCRDRAFT_93991 [Piloderma croceum F 1598]|uniref:Uncharacterized protein n=1 Tax=Piloderma croceum (strain F 1598) TaxID=765440 RepID=A0A0C3ETR2_PILCF|nr:hypothetical protein PILCRDRAFT_93991 [Piloderma croceum F 1598]
MFRSLGMFSVVAISNFLLRHPGIHELQFVGGYLYEIFFLLKAILSPPVLCTLRIETDPPARVPHIPFIEQVIDILAMCKGSFPLYIVLTKENIAKLMFADALVLAANKLSPSTLPSISSLCIGFHLGSTTPSNSDSYFPGLFTTLNTMLKILYFSTEPPPQVT